MNTFLRGALSGLSGTATMSALMGAGKVSGLMQEAPPKEITARAGWKADVAPAALPEPAFDAAWLAAHVGYGTASGVGYGLLRDVLPGNTLVRGLLFGEGLWAFSYLGVMPALGLYPWPGQDSWTRRTLMIAAHAVFGVTVAAVAQQLGGEE